MSIGKWISTFLGLPLAFVLPVPSILAVVTPEEVAEEVNYLIKTEALSQKCENPNQVRDSKAITCNCCRGYDRTGDSEKWCCYATCCQKNEADLKLKSSDQSMPKAPMKPTLMTKSSLSNKCNPVPHASLVAGS